MFNGFVGLYNVPKNITGVYEEPYTIGNESGTLVVFYKSFQLNDDDSFTLFDKKNGKGEFLTYEPLTRETGSIEEAAARVGKSIELLELAKSLKKTSSASTPPKIEPTSTNDEVDKKANPIFVLAGLGLLYVFLS